MADLKINYNKIKNLISLHEEYWENDFFINCYAFALGLDIPENQIMENAYQLGTIGASVKNIPIEKIKKLTFEDRLIIDLNASGIKEDCSNIYDKSGYYFSPNYIYTWWIISLLSNGKNYHFIRKSYNGI